MWWKEMKMCGLVAAQGNEHHKISSTKKKFDRYLTDFALPLSQWNV